MNPLDRIVPKPAEAVPLPGVFAWNANSILLHDGESDHNRFAVDSWARACRERGLPAPARSTDPADRPRAAFVVAQRDRLPMTLDLLASVASAIPDSLGTEGYFLEITPRRVFLTADTAAGLFYGVQTLIALLPDDPEEANAALPCARIGDRPGVLLRGYMQDFGRGQTPTLDTLKRTVERLASFKLNAFFPYFEDGYHFPSHPAIGANRDRLEPEEARELVEFARRHHVRIIPIHETIAHMDGLLDQPDFQYLREGEGVRTRSIINLAHPDTLRILEETIADLCDVFPDPLFFCATDECLDLGTEASKPQADLLGAGGLFVGHLKRLREILANYGKRMVISPDPIQPDFFKAFGLANYGEEFLRRTPRDIVFAPWHYGRMETHPFGEFLREHGIDQILWGATAHSGRLFPHVAGAAENAFTFMPFAHSQNALGGVASQWDGHPGDSTFVEYDWPLIAYFAETLWNPEPRAFEAFLPACLETMTGAPEAAAFARPYRLLGETDSFLPWGGQFLDSPSHKQLYRPLEPCALDTEQRGRIAELRAALHECRETLESVSPTVRRYEDMVQAFGFAVAHLSLLPDLVAARHAVARTPTLPDADQNNLLRQLDAIRSRYAQSWEKAYKPLALPKNLARFDALADSIKGQRRGGRATPPPETH